MLLLYAAITLGTVGKLILGLAVLRVHWLILKEHKIDATVLTSMRHEQLITIVGIAFIVLGYLLEMYFYYHNTALLS